MHGEELPNNENPNNNGEDLPDLEEVFKDLKVVGKLRAKQNQKMEKGKNTEEVVVVVSSNRAILQDIRPVTGSKAQWTNIKQKETIMGISRIES